MDSERFLPWIGAAAVAAGITLLVMVIRDIVRVRRRRRPADVSVDFVVDEVTPLEPEIDPAMAAEESLAMALREQLDVLEDRVAALRRRWTSVPSEATSGITHRPSLGAMLRSDSHETQALRRLAGRA